MSTSTDLSNKTKPIIRRLTQGKTLSVSIPSKFQKQAQLKKGDYVFCLVDDKNRLVFEKVNLNLEETE